MGGSLGNTIGDSTNQSGADTIYGGAGVDYIYGYGGGDAIYGGTGNDYIYAYNSSSSTSNSSDTSANTLQGGAGNDIIFGAGGVDTITGGAGSDTITGNNGADIFVYTTTSDSAVGGSVDWIKDFVAGGSGDKIDIGINGTLGVIANQAAGDTYANLVSTNWDTLNALVNSTNGTLGTKLSGGSTNTEVMQLTTSDSQVLWVIDVDGSGVLDASDSVIEVTDLSGTLSTSDFI